MVYNGRKEAANGYEEQTAADKNKEELDRLRSDKVIADVAEGFAEIERGEYVVLTREDLLEKIENAQSYSG